MDNNLDRFVVRVKEIEIVIQRKFFPAAYGRGGVETINGQQNDRRIDKKENANQESPSKNVFCFYHKFVPLVLDSLSVLKLPVSHENRNMITSKSNARKEPIFQRPPAK